MVTGTGGSSGNGNGNGSRKRTLCNSSGSNSSNSINSISELLKCVSHECGQEILLLCGPVASGKSTLCHSIMSASASATQTLTNPSSIPMSSPNSTPNCTPDSQTHPNSDSGSGSDSDSDSEWKHRYIRINQDILKTTPACIQTATNALKQGFSVCIDNTNLTKDVRGNWVKLAQEYGVKVLLVLVYVVYICIVL